MKEKILTIIKEKIEWLKNESAPTYCGEEYYNQWKAENEAQRNILEELIDDIESL
ncbi:MAG: hypothetical protein PHT02_01135 [Tissierellia bacterium]|nr:hypothetical protein [Tissierellia bacterium]